MEGMASIAAENLHQLRRVREPCFTLSRYDRHSGKRAMEKAPAHHLID